MSAFGGKADMRFALHMSAYDPKRTSASNNTEPKATPNDLLEPSLARAMIGSLQRLI